MPNIRREITTDPIAERLTRHSDPRLKKIILVVYPTLAALAGALSLLMPGMGFWLLAAGSLVGFVGFARRFSRERLLVSAGQNVVATVTDSSRRSVGEDGYHFEAKYIFIAADGQVYSGKGNAPLELPQPHHTIPVRYLLNAPAVNMPLASFWFYSFSYTATE